MEIGYVDVHTHLSDERFQSDVETVIRKAIDSGFNAIISNGLDPESNRFVLSLAERFPVIKPALGIYPLNVLQDYDYSQTHLDIPQFNVESEMNFIAQMAEQGKIIAIGECGLDGHWVGEETFPEQEQYFEQFIDIASKYNLPLIIHTRKLEKRAIEILHSFKVEKVNFHCYGGKVNLALQAAQNFDWCFSIPCNARKNQAFAKLLAELPLEKILTETDAPYLAPISGQRNEPINIVDTVQFLAEIRQISHLQAKQQIWENYNRLFIST